MATKRYCDFCGTELETRSDIDTMEFFGDEKDVCKECADKILEFLNSITKIRQ